MRKILYVLLSLYCLFFTEANAQSVRQKTRLDKGWHFTFGFASLKTRAPKHLSARVLCGQSPDDYNDRGDEHVRPEQRKLKVKDSQVSIPAHSITFLMIE